MQIKRNTRGISIELECGSVYELIAVAESIIRFRISNPRGVFGWKSGLEKYAFIREPEQQIEFNVEEDSDAVTLSLPGISARLSEDGTLSFLNAENKEILSTNKESVPCYYPDGRYEISFEREEGEKFFGFGDQTRERTEHSGNQAIMWIRNISSYIPVPFFMSTRGYALLNNNTWKHFYDMGQKDPKSYSCAALGGDIDFYIFGGNSPKELLGQYTMLSGRPPLPPLFSFGLWFLCDTSVDVYEMLDTAKNFRQKDIPCDLMGLEPGWMEKYYDYSVDRKWSEERFPIDKYASKAGRCFISALERLGFKLGLWECNDYDLSIEAERQHKTEQKKEEDFPENKSHNGLHFSFMPHDSNIDYTWKLDKLTRDDQSWFEHHKKFVDMGVCFFKQDGANQTLEHPDRAWANKMCDNEMHNLYPLLYSQQMHEGFRKHTQKRPLCFTVNGYAGLQRYTGTWTGDTGGKHENLVGMLNLAFCGHSYMTCDMEPDCKESIHFGMLLPWAHHNNFKCFYQPWLLGKELEDAYRFYAKLRYSLIPYIYSHAYEAWQTGIPIMRPMKLEFPEDPNTDNLLHQYLLGKDILVGAFTDLIYIPEGKWIDFWTGKEYSGCGFEKISYPDHCGGPLLIRQGSILPMIEPMQYTDQKPWNRIILRLFSEDNGDALIYEDDGLSLGYEEKEFATTSIKTIFGSDAFVIDIAQRSGSYCGMPDRSYEIVLPSTMKYQQISVCGEQVELISDAKIDTRENQKSNYAYKTHDGETHVILNEFDNGGTVNFKA